MNLLVYTEDLGGFGFGLVMQEREGNTMNLLNTATREMKAP